MKLKLKSALSTVVICVAFSSSAFCQAFINIDQAAVTNGNAAIGDAPGEPLTIGVQGNFRLTGPIVGNTNFVIGVGEAPIAISVGPIIDITAPGGTRQPL